MSLKDIHIVGLESPQRGVDRLHDVLTRQAFVVMSEFAYGPVSFGQNLDRFPPHPAQCGAQYFLRSAVCIRVRGVQGGDTCVKSGMDAVPRRIVFDLRAVRQPVAIGNLSYAQATVS